MLIRDGFGAAVIGQLKSMGEPVTEINFEAVRQTAKYSYEIKR